MSVDAVTKNRLDPPPAGHPRSGVIRIRQLNHYYGQGELRKQVLFQNQLDVNAGEIVIMTGPSGSGKTTLLSLIGTLRSVQEGSLQVLGCELKDAGTSQLVRIRRQIGFIFQAHNLFNSLSAVQNVRMAMELFDLPQTEVQTRSEQVLTRLGLGHRLYYKPEALSGGQKQRVAIARALAHQPRIVLADEPTAALDEQSGREVVTLFQELAREEGCTILMVTHDNRILDVADRIVNMVDGRIKSDVLVQESAIICEFLQQCPMFSRLTPRTLTEVADRMSAEQHAAGTRIIRQGGPGDKFYLIRGGSVDILVADARGEHVVAHLEPGDYFGEAALLTGQPRNASVVASEDLLLYALSAADFQRVLEGSSTFEEELRKALFERA